MAVWAPLQGPQHFRLLAIAPETPGQDSLEVMIEQFDINQAPEYFALSYAWGDPAQRVQIQSNNGPLQVTPNLHAALLRIRQKRESLRLWIDAVCIHQDDDVEKSAQIPLMGRIYSQAKFVVMWVGEEDELTSTAMEATEIFESLVMGDGRIKAFSGLVDDRSRLCHAILKMLQRPYFSRAWIVQEVILSQNAIVFCGSRITSYDKLVIACYWIKYSGLSPSILHLDSMILSAWTLRRTRSLGEETRGTRLTNVLGLYRRMKATDPRDKVYALLGIAPSSDTSGIVPDYSQSVASIYTGVAKYLIEKEGNLTIFTDVLGNSGHMGLPSWVPDWSSVTDIYCLGRQTFRDSRAYHAAGKTVTVEKKAGNRDQINLRGFIVDMITRCCQPSQSSMRKDHYFLKSLWDEVAIIMETRSRSLYTFTGERCEEAYLKTLSADTYPWSERNTLNLSGDFPEHSKWLQSDAQNINLVSDWWQWIQTGQVAERVPSAVIKEIMDHMSTITRRRNVFVTEKGYLGLGREDLRKGDLVCILLGGNLPYLLRPKSDTIYQFLGECYVHGIMDGEAMKGACEGSYQDFVLE